MASFKRFKLCVMLLPFLMLSIDYVKAQDEEGIKSNCVASQPYIGDTASITCNFSVDLLKESKAFRMYRYDLTSSSSKTVNELTVLDCFFRDFGDPECGSPAPGYEFNGTFTDQVTVTIPTATLEFQGRYECRAEPSYGRYIDDCYFLIKDRPSTQITTVGSVSEQNNDAGGEEDTNAAAIAVPIILLIIIAAVVVVAVIVRKKISTLFPALQHFPALPRFWGTREDVITDPERAGVQYDNLVPLLKTTEGHSAEQLATDMTGRVLLPKEQYVSVSARDLHSSEKPGGHEEEEEEEEVFVFAIEDQSDLMAKSNERLAPHDGILPTKSGQDTASSAVDTKEETNENLYITSFRDSGGSFHQTSSIADELLPTGESILPVPAVFADAQDVVHPDINGVEEAHSKHPIQATGETENNNTVSTESNFEEIHPADDGGDDGDNRNTEEPAAVATQKEKEDSAGAEAHNKQLIKLLNFDNIETEDASKTQ